MSVEPTTSSVDLNSFAVAYQEELQNRGDEDSASRVCFNNNGCDEANNVSDAVNTEGISKGCLLDAESDIFLKESRHNGVESPNFSASIMNSDNDLKFVDGSPNVDEANKIDAKHPIGDENLTREDDFADDNEPDKILYEVSSSGAVDGDQKSKSVPEIQKKNKPRKYADKKKLEGKEEQMSKSEFSHCDVVWGKVRSHPWWPGQIFHPSFASGMALKHRNKDNFLVAYFGDKTFAWNDKSRLKHFEPCFSRMEKQSSLDEFAVAVDKALGEVARRIEIGMTCGCIADDLIAHLKLQMVENAGIKEGAFYPTMDQCRAVSSFDPDWLIGYIHALAQFPFGYSDKLEFVKARAQLKAISLSKGYSELPEFCFGELLEDQEEISDLKGDETRQDGVEYRNDGIHWNEVSLKEKRRSHGRSSAKKVIEENGRKHKSIPELMEQTVDLSVLNPKKRKFGVNATSKSYLPYGRSLKIGQCVSRAAKKMNTLTSAIKFEDIKTQMSVSKVNLRTSPVQGGRKAPRPDYPLTSDLLSMLCLAAKAPTKIHRFQSMVVDFFMNCRDSHVLDSLNDDDDKPLKLLISEKRQDKLAEPSLISVEVIKSDYVQDSYWPDVIFERIPNQADDPYKGRKRKSKPKRNLKKKIKTDGSTFLMSNLQEEEELEDSTNDKAMEGCF